MKVAIYSGAIPSTTFIENLIKDVSKTNTVYLFGTKNGEYTCKSQNIKIVYNYKSKVRKLTVTAFRLLLVLLKYPNRIKVLFKELKKYESRYSKFMFLSRAAGVMLHLPDIFHVQWAKDLEKWLFLKEQLDVKIVLSLLGSHINYSPIKDKVLAQSYRDNFPKVDKFHAVSYAISKEASKYGAEGHKTQVIRTILSEELFIKPSNSGITSRKIKILSVGRYHWIKGYRYALDAIKILKDNNILVDYTIVAMHSNNEELLYHINQLNLEDSVTVINGLSQKDVFSLMTTSNLLLLPSLNEGIANVVLEAMAMSLPVISADCGGMSEVVKHKETGWLVPIRNPKAIANAVIDYSQTSDVELSNIIKNASELIKSEFNTKENIAQFIDLYKSVIN